MSVISWGKPTIEVGKVATTGTQAYGTKIDTPKQDTTQLNTTEGTVTEAKEEGGEVVDTRYDKPTYQLEFDLFVKKGFKRPIAENDDGLVSDEYAVKVTPEDTACVGITMPRCRVSTSVKYTAADGILYHYVFKALKPTTGKTLDLTNVTA